MDLTRFRSQPARRPRRAARGEERHQRRPPRPPQSIGDERRAGASAPCAQRQAARRQPRRHDPDSAGRVAGRAGALNPRAGASNHHRQRAVRSRHLAARLHHCGIGLRGDRAPDRRASPNRQGRARCHGGHHPAARTDTRSPRISGSISSSFRRRTRQPRCRTRCCSKTRSRPSCGAGIRVWATRFTRISTVAFRMPWSAFPTTRASTTTSAWENKLAVELHAQVVAPSYHALPALIVGTDRIATLQMRLAEKLAASYPIRVVPLPLPLPVLEEAMMWHPRLDRDAGHAWLRGVLRETAAALPAMGRAPHGAVQHRPRRRPA